MRKQFKSRFIPALAFIAIATFSPIETSAQTIQLFRFSESGISGCTAQAAERNNRNQQAPVYAAWSRENKYGVMKINGRFYRYSYSDNGFDNYNAKNDVINWRIGSLIFQLKYSSGQTAEELYGGDGILKATNSVNGKGISIPVRVSGGC